MLHICTCDSQAVPKDRSGPFLAPPSGTVRSVRLVGPGWSLETGKN